MEDRLKFIADQYGHVCALIFHSFIKSFPNRCVEGAWIDPRHDKIMKEHNLTKEVYYLNITRLVQAQIVLVKRIRRKDVYFCNLSQLEKDYSEHTELSEKKQ